MVQPTNKVRINTISVAEWTNPKGKSYTIQRSWKGKDDTEWQSQSITLFPEQLDDVVKAIEEIKAQK